MGNILRNFFISKILVILRKVHGKSIFRHYQPGFADENIYSEIIYALSLREAMCVAPVSHNVAGPAAPSDFCRT